MSTKVRPSVDTDASQTLMRNYLEYAARIKDQDINLIAPQHGSLLNNRKQIHQLIELLADLDGIGIDHIC